MKTNKLNIEKKYGYLVMDGTYYLLNHKDGKPSFERVTKKEVNKKIDNAKQMTEKLVMHLDGHKILMETLTNLDQGEFDKLYKMLFKSKRKYKPKTREGHCVDMKIGGFILPIVD